MSGADATHKDGSVALGARALADRARRGMRVCLDVSPAVHGRAGMGRYAQELATALLALGGETEYTLFYNRAREATLEPPLDRLPRLTTDLGDKPWRMRVLLAHLAHRPQDELLPGIDLFHATDHLLPCLARVGSVFSLQDLTFRRFPETQTPLNRWFLTLMVPRFLRAAGAVVVSAESVRQETARWYGLDGSTIRVVPHGVSERFRPAGAGAVAAARRRYSLPEHLILYVGTIEPRKNLTALLAAYAALRAQGQSHRLAVVGRKGWRHEGFFRRLRELGLEDEVILPGFVPDEDLPALYTAAELFVFPSLYEGFGLPVLEAMACGVPVVCSDRPSLPEVAGEAAVVVPPDDVVALATAMERILTDPAWGAELRGRGLARVKGYTWERVARQMARIYAEIAHPHP